MEPDHPRRIDEIFQAALDLAPERRAAFLDEACAGDVQMRAEIESRLSAHQQAPDLIEVTSLDRATSSFENTPPPGGRVGQYKIEKLLGAGGMGEVYLASDKMGRKVALKLLASRLVTNQQYIARFTQEASTVLALNHPNIVTIYDLGEIDGTYYIASELIEGDTLRDRLEARELELGAALETSIQVATALVAAHQKGIVHRDIKPENVMIRADGYVKVLDFGIAKLTDDFVGLVSTDAPTRRKIETAEGAVVGTTTYMSPEQARGLKVDARTDIWSLGVMLYEMLTDKSPFAGDSAAEVVASILNREPAPLARYVTDPPAELQRIVSKALMKNRDGRYQTIKDMLLDLKALKQELEFSSKLAHSLPQEDEANIHIPSPATAQGSNAGAKSQSRAIEAREATYPVSSAEYIVSEIKQHKRASAVVVGVLLLGMLVSGYWFFGRGPSKASTIDSIAVMPFENLTHDQNTEYFSDGVTESLINSLSQLPHVKVISRSSVFSYKGQTPNLQQVAQTLKVQAILTGRVLLQGDTIDVRVELTDAEKNAQLWGDHYTRKAADIFSVQDEIARQVTDTLRVRLTSAQQEQIKKRYTENAEAYRLYLQGRYYFNQGTEEDLNRAVSFFDRAIALDPRYALAYAARGDCFGQMGDLSLPMSEANQKAKQDSATALSIDDTLAEARTTQAVIKFGYDWNFVGAEEDFKQAIALDPNYADAHHQYSYYLALTGRPMEGVAEMKLAQQLDPVNPVIVVDTILPYYLARQYDQSIAQARKHREMFPNFFLPHMGLGSALIEKGDISAGVAELEKAKAIEPTPLVKGNLGYAYAKAGRKDEARKLLAELKAQSTTRYVASYWIAVIHAGLGEKDEAFAWLEKAYQEHSWWLVWIKMDPHVDSLRSDSRFTDLMRRIGFPQ